MRNLFALIGRLREQNGGFADRFVAAHTPAPTNTEDEKEDEEEEAEGSEADEEEAEGSEPEGDGSPEHEEPEHDSKGHPEKKVQVQDRKNRPTLSLSKRPQLQRKTVLPAYACSWLPYRRNSTRG